MDVKVILTTTKVRGHIPLSFSMSTISSFRNIETKYDLYRDKNCIKNLSVSKENCQNFS